MERIETADAGNEKSLRRAERSQFAPIGMKKYKAGQYKKKIDHQVSVVDKTPRVEVRLPIDVKSDHRQGGDSPQRFQRGEK
jgi:hypothetical protein